MKKIITTTMKLKGRKEEKILKRFRNRKGTRIWFYDSEPKQTVLVYSKKNKKEMWNDSLTVDPNDISSMLDDYRVLMIILRNDKIARRWLKKELGEMIIKDGKKFKDYL